MDYWQKQTSDAPLFDDILWSRPETRHGAGKLLVIGGNAHGFSAVGQAYAAAEAAGAGTIRAVLPDILKKTVGPLGPYEFAPSTPSGSFARDALDELLNQAQWADGVLLAGDFGRNSETAILLESFLQKYIGPLVVTKDAVDYFSHQPEVILARPDTAVVLSMAQLQRLGTALKFETPFLLSMGMLLLVQALHTFSQQYQAVTVTKELDHLLVAHQGRVSSTKLSEDKETWRVETAAKASVLWLQNKNRPYEAITTSIIT